MQAIDVTIQVDHKLPKYQQFTNILINKINRGEFKKGARLPSIMDSSAAYGLSRDTVLKGYKNLYDRGFLTSIYRKGYFVSLPSTGKPGKKILVAISATNSANFLFYQQLSKIMEENYIQCDFKIYHNDINRLGHFINEAAGIYHTYIVDPQLQAKERILNLFKNKVADDGVILLNDQNVTYEPNRRHILLNMEEDFCNALEQLKDRLGKYKTLNLMLPPEEYFPYKLINGFFNYCDQNCMTGHILEDVKQVEKGNAYIIMDEKSLFSFMNIICKNQMKMGQDVGLLALFERPYLQYMTKKVSSLNWFNNGLIDCIVSAIKTNFKRCVRAEVELNIRESL